MTTQVHEFEGKTTEDAVRKACEVLGLPENRLEIEVSSYGSSGIFGLVGAKKARIRVTCPATCPSAQQEDAAESSPADSISADFSSGDSISDVYAEADADVSDEVQDTISFDDDVADESSDLAPAEIEKVAEVAKKVAGDLFAFLIEDAAVSVSVESGKVAVTVQGQDTAILIGKHGRTLDALQHMVQKIVLNKTKSRVWVGLDIGGYRERRKASLTQLALRLGEKAERSGKPVTINPMNAYDRRIIHIALKSNSKIRTQSMGSGSLRKLLILPQDRRHSRGGRPSSPQESV